MDARQLGGFLESIAPILGVRSAAYRNVGGSVRRRLARRLGALGLPGLADYRCYLDHHPEEWQWLDACCRITISRFARDAVVFESLMQAYLPALARAAGARGDARLRVWSAGAASGEEPYSVAIAYGLGPAASTPGVSLEVIATDADPRVLGRAACGLYPGSSLAELPAALRRRAFEQRGEQWRLRRTFRTPVRFQRADLRREHPEGPFDLALCRNVAFTYFDEPLQRRVAGMLERVLVPGGLLILGAGEELPEGAGLFSRTAPGVYRRLASRASEAPQRNCRSDD